MWVGRTLPGHGHPHVTPLAPHKSASCLPTPSLLPSLLRFPSVVPRFRHLHLGAGTPLSWVTDTIDKRSTEMSKGFEYSTHFSCIFSVLQLTLPWLWDHKGKRSQDLFPPHGAEIARAQALWDQGRYKGRMSFLKGDKRWVRKLVSEMWWRREESRGEGLWCGLWNSWV